MPTPTPTPTPLSSLSFHIHNIVCNLNFLSYTLIHLHIFEEDRIEFIFLLVFFWVSIKGASLQLADSVLGGQGI